MSEYKNFIQDFPKRCGKILEKYEKRAGFEGVEVTLMLSIASAGFTIPYERMRQPGETKQSHPSGDRGKYQKAADQLDRLWKQEFLGSHLWGASPESWCFGELESHLRMPDSWPEMKNPKPISKYKETKGILNHLRNALAHGNIYTMGTEIKSIIFLSEKFLNAGKFNYLMMSPRDFCKFLQNWFAFIDGLNIPQEASIGFIDDNIDCFQEVVND